MKDIEQALKRIAEYYKTKQQEVKLIEEMGELQVEVSKNIMNNIVTDNTVSEIADVTILLKQLCYLYGIEEEVDKKIEYKIDRQIKRIDGEI